MKWSMTLMNSDSSTALPREPALSAWSNCREKRRERANSSSRRLRSLQCSSRPAASDGVTASATASGRGLATAFRAGFPAAAARSHFSAGVTTRGRSRPNRAVRRHRQQGIHSAAHLTYPGRRLQRYCSHRSPRAAPWAQYGRSAPNARSTCTCGYRKPTRPGDIRESCLRRDRAARPGTDPDPRYRRGSFRSGAACFRPRCAGGCRRNPRTRAARSSGATDSTPGFGPAARGGTCRPTRSMIGFIRGA